MTEKEILHDHDSLWGPSGGLLEYVGQRVETHVAEGNPRSYIVLLFKDHDHCTDDEIEPGVHFRVKQPINLDKYQP